MSEATAQLGQQILKALDAAWFNRNTETLQGYRIERQGDKLAVSSPTGQGGMLGDRLDAMEFLLGELLPN